ncbi:MAG: hypothetical protein HWN65_20640 [Candidatus Helarchaeota archaeon]|nr:hypothetical protein [Candidatus Helarchaeota archaeon]
MTIDILYFSAFGMRFILFSSVTFLAILFLLKIKNARNSGIDLSPFIGLSIFFLSFGISRIFFGYSDYYMLEFSTEILSLYKGGVLSGYLGIIGVVFLSEKMLGKTKFGFTIFSIIGCIFCIVFLHTPDQIRWFTYIAMPISMMAVVANISISLILKTSGIIRRYMGLALLSLMLFSVFVVADTKVGQEFAYNLWGLPIALTIILAEIGMIATSTLLGFCFLSFETFTEFGWKDKLKELFIIAPSGATLFHYSFIKEARSRDPDLITSGLTGVKGILGEMVQSKKTLKVVDHQDVKIIFEYGAHATLALIAQENLRILHSKLATLSTQFENLFQDVLSHWVGETEVFLPSKHLIEEIFK